MKPDLDQKSAIMLVIEYLGDLRPGTKCSAVFFDRDKIRREKDFYARLYSENGVHDPAILREMVSANVPDDPYWLVSFKPADATPGQEAQLYRLDDRTRKVFGDSTKNPLPGY